jgi:putative AbiEii toxin of type IV toxin-antitoxin system/AAA ATPase-like protein
MLITRIQVVNYKSYRESAEMKLGRGFNVIVGQNSSGKSALLETLRPGFPQRPHRSVETIPIEGGVSTDPNSNVRLGYRLTLEEMLKHISKHGIAQVYIPMPSPGDAFLSSIGIHELRPEFSERFIREFFAREPQFDVVRGWQGTVSRARFPSFQTFRSETLGNGQMLAAEFHRSPEANLVFGGLRQVDPTFDVGLYLAPTVLGDVYVFAAERFNIGRFRAGHSRQLHQNAQNLPEVLLTLQSNPARFREFVDTVTSVLPQIKDVSLRPVQHDIEILIWPIDSTSKREDLAIPLDQCGTGVAQVLAILYVAVCEPSMQTIVIDEPQSFLHPGAARKLIEILKKYPHQYIIATHSPVVIAAAEPATLISAVLKGSETHLSQSNLGSTPNLRASLMELGARLSDVFGADNVLWVEGLTEELCLPVILERVAKVPLMGTVILGVRNTSDFEGMKTEDAITIYTRICTSSQVFPVAIGFLFDRELRPESKMADIKRGNHPRVEFTNRRMFENYLLSPRAIAAILRMTDCEPPINVSPEAVQAEIDILRAQAKMYEPSKNVPGGVEWENEIDAGRLFTKLFAKFTDTKVQYRKPVHGLQLTEWICAHEPERFTEIVNVLKTFLIH